MRWRRSFACSNAIEGRNDPERFSPYNSVSALEILIAQCRNATPLNPDSRQVINRFLRKDIWVLLWDLNLSSPLKKPPGEGTGPTTHADSQGNIVGRVPSRGEQDVFQPAVRHGSFEARFLILIFLISILNLFRRNRD